MKGSQQRLVSVRRRRRAMLGFVLAGLLALGVPTPVMAFQTTGAQGLAQRLSDECQRLRSELARANAEISALKRGDRGVRDDYRLRRRMADAEQLARQLTAAEAELRRLRGPSPVAPVPATPKLEPGEAPGVLEARADLLSDQARRLNQEAAGLARAATQLRTRQTLRRRAGQVERDPFGAMDGSKRFMIVRGAQSQAGTDKTTFTGSPGQGSEGTTAVAPGGAGGMGTASPTVAPAPPGAPTPPPQPSPPPAGDSGRSSTPPGLTAGTPTTASGLGTRALLDPAIAAELRRLDASAGAPVSEAERLQRAAAALTRRAQTLEAEARALRARAQKR